jgi:hypothetical protein
MVSAARVCATRDVDSNRAKLAAVSASPHVPFILHQRSSVVGEPLEKLDSPQTEAQTEYVLHGFSHPICLVELRPNRKATSTPSHQWTRRCGKRSGN